MRIHHVTGLGGSVGDGEGPGKPVVNQALDSIMEMAVQLPALRKLGEDLGMSMDAGLSGVTGELVPRNRPGANPDTDTGTAGEPGEATGRPRKG
ncbi:MAG: hypothetical protein JSW68_08260 [Burkholderiales bacterium]|nr:MAG: hypothetical protein JSW68_08260 [Burkholderiales bacterium]